MIRSRHTFSTVVQAIARRLPVLLLPLALLLLLSACGGGKEQLILATTTSTQDTGLLDVLVPMFQDQYGYNVKTIAVGSGQALRMGQQGEADVLLSHSPKAEEDFMKGGYGESRDIVMHNDFVIVGPPDDPAGIASARDAATAFKRIAEHGATFLSRGDDSGTNAKELTLWDKAGVKPAGQSWYVETGQGMGATLRVADQKRGYTLSDRGTYLAQKANFKLSILSQGDAALFNVYHVIVVNPKKHPQVNVKGARAFAAFITSPATQAVIRDFGAGKYGQALFVADALVKAGTPAPTR